MPDRIREIRYLIQSSVSSAFTAANAAGWATGTAIKAAPISWENGAAHVGIPSEVLQTRKHGTPPHIVGVQEGTIKIGHYMGRGSSDTSDPAMATLLKAFFGGLESPTAKTDLVEAASTSTTINCTSHGMKAGMAVLIGTRGDGRGNGEVRRIATIPDANSYTLEMALSNAPDANDAIVNSHTVHLDQDATQQYLDLLAIGWHAEDQFQALGCIGPVTFGGLGVGEVPQFDVNMNFVQWQEVPSGERDQLEPSAAGSGDEAPANKALGGCFLGDWGVTTRHATEGGEWAVDPQLAFELREDRNSVNGIGAYVKTGASPTFELTVPIDYDFGLHADWSAQTEKQLLLQFGHTAQRCVALTLPRIALDAAPARTALNNLSALKLVGHALEPTVGASADNVYSSAISAHWF